MTRFMKMLPGLILLTAVVLVATLPLPKHPVKEESVQTMTPSMPTLPVKPAEPFTLTATNRAFHGACMVLELRQKSYRRCFDVNGEVEFPAIAKHTGFFLQLFGANGKTMASWSVQQEQLGENIADASISLPNDPWVPLLVVNEYGASYNFQPVGKEWAADPYFEVSQTFEVHMAARIGGYLWVSGKNADVEALKGEPEVSINRMTFLDFDRIENPKTVSIMFQPDGYEKPLRFDVDAEELRESLRWSNFDGEYLVKRQQIYLAQDAATGQYVMWVGVGSHDEIESGTPKLSGSR